MTAKSCQGQSIPGSLKSCRLLESSPPQNVGSGKGCSSTLSMAPFTGQKIEAQGGEATGPRSHSGIGTQQGIKSFWSWSRSLKLASAQCWRKSMWKWTVCTHTALSATSHRGCGFLLVPLPFLLEARPRARVLGNQNWRGLGIPLDLWPFLHLLVSEACVDV